MRLTLKQLRALQVETVSGVQLGHVHEVVFETEGQMMAQYVVKASLLSAKEYLISRSQIVRFAEKKLVVDDGVKSIADTSVEKRKPAVSAEPVAMRK